MVTRIVGLFVCFSVSTTCFSQSNIYSFFKLIVINNQKQVMLVKWEDSWEFPGARYDKPLTTRQFIGSFASDHGITVTDPRLGGMITFHYVGRPNPTMMLYYTCLYKGGKLKVPEDCTDIRWFSKEEALKVIPYETMKMIFEKIQSNGKVVWGGAFKIEGDGKNRKSSVLESFYPMN